MGHTYPFFPFSSRKIDGTRTPRDERRRAQHNEGKVRRELLVLTGSTAAGCLESQISGRVIDPSTREVLVECWEGRSREVPCQEHI